MNDFAKPITRFIAHTIDLLVSSSIFMFMVLILSKSNEIYILLDNLFIIFLFLITFSLLMGIINSLLISQFGGSVGKLLTGIKIVDKDGKNITFWQAFLRTTIFFSVSKYLLNLGLIWIFIDKQRRAWHDMIMDTYVVLVNKKVMIIGILFLIIISWLNVLIIKNSVTNFMDNSYLYQELFDEVSKSMGNNNI